MPNRSLLRAIAHSWTQLSVRRQGFIAISLPLLCFLGSLGAFSWLRFSIDRSQRWVDHTNQVLVESNQLLNGLLDAETGVRGYVLTLRPEFLAPYYTAQSSLPGRLGRLKQLVRDNPQQKQQLQEIETAIDARFAVLIALIEQVDRSDSKSLQKEDIDRLVVRGKVEMDNLRADLARFEREEERLLNARRTELSFQRNVNEILLWTAAAIGVLASAFALSLYHQLDRNLAQREQRLLESKNLIEVIVSNIVDGVVILDREGLIESINAAAASIFGYTLAQAIGRDLSLLLDLSLTENPSDPTALTQYLLSRERQWQTNGRRNNGELFPVEISVSQIPLDRRTIVIVRDITERQQAAAKLQNRAEELSLLNTTLASINAELRSRNLELDQFAYVASHDLKAPLRAIASLSEWIEEDLADRLPEENKHQIHLLRSRVQRMEALINGLLQYSRIGRTQIPVETVDVRALLEEVVDTLALPPTFAVKLAPEMPIFKTRRLALQQVFTNLLENAYKHHPRADGTVTVTAIDRGQWYEFAIADDGEGIDPQYHDKIFTIFQTLRARDTQESTGIGLAIIQKILETEGGSIRVESQEGDGATFRFTWPKSPLRQGDRPKPLALEGRH
ncbi:CHASE3 domain-containing protein [Altericista sp. CCNU0014]|uniref:sensor histidine kinase n=1 Tax=Altericista sp. CCNU0014 TaxID=3082949 RepID=UPI00384FA71D